MSYSKIGKIKNVYLGKGGYQDAMLGVTFDLGGDRWGVSDFVGTWGPSISSRGAKWTEGDRDAQYAKVMRRIGELLVAAKKERLDQLKNVPVEVTFSGNNNWGGSLESWRVLTEVI